MAEWIVTYTSMPIEAETAEQAIARDSNGGGHWNAHPAYPNRPEFYDLEVTPSEGDAGLPMLEASVGPVDVLLYQHRDTNDQPLPVVVVEVDHPEDVEIRAYY